MSKAQEKRGEFVASIPVYGPDDVSTLDSERMWDILHYVHERPMGVRPKEVAKKFDTGINQAYNKLRMLEKAGYLIRKKQRGRPGRPPQAANNGAQRKTLLYVSAPWGRTALDYDWNRVLMKKYGRHVMEEIRPVILKFYKRVIDDLKIEENLRAWYPAPYENVCPECGTNHQALELFRSLSIFATDVIEEYSYEMYRILLENGYITQQEFEEDTAKDEEDEEWAFSDKSMT